MNRITGTGNLENGRALGLVYELTQVLEKDILYYLAPDRDLDTSDTFRPIASMDLIVFLGEMAGTEGLSISLSRIQNWRKLCFELWDNDDREAWPERRAVMETTFDKLEALARKYPA